MFDKNKFNVICKCVFQRHFLLQHDWSNKHWLFLPYDYYSKFSLNDNLWPTLILITLRKMLTSWFWNHYFQDNNRLKFDFISTYHMFDNLLLFLLLFLKASLMSKSIYCENIKNSCYALICWRNLIDLVLLNYLQ